MGMAFQKWCPPVPRPEGPEELPGGQWHRKAWLVKNWSLSFVQLDKYCWAAVHVGEGVRGPLGTPRWAGQDWMLSGLRGGEADGGGTRSAGTWTRTEKAPHSGLGCQGRLPRRPSERPKAAQSRGRGTGGEGGKEPHSGHLLWPLPSAVVTGGSTVSLSSVGVNVGQRRREPCGRPMDFAATLLLQPTPSSLVLQHIPCYSLPLPLLCPNLPHKCTETCHKGSLNQGFMMTAECLNWWAKYSK